MRSDGFVFCCLPYEPLIEGDYTDTSKRSLFGRSHFHSILDHSDALGVGISEVLKRSAN